MTIEEISNQCEKMLDYFMEVWAPIILVVGVILTLMFLTLLFTMIVLGAV